MSELLFSIGKYYGIDSLLEFLIICVSLVISLYSYKIYKILKEKKLKYFSLGFLLIAVSLFFKIISNLTIVHRVAIRSFDHIFIITSQLEIFEWIQFLSFLLYKTFHLIGLLFLFFMAFNYKDKEEKIMFIYFGIIIILFSIPLNFIFNLTIMFILSFLTLFFYDNYRKNKLSNSFIVFLGFLLLAISHFILVFSEFNGFFYVLGELIMLGGFISLLINQFKIKNEKKKK